MRIVFLTVTVFFLMLSCKKERQGSNVQESGQERQDSIAEKQYSSEEWDFEVGYPPQYEVGEFRLPGEAPLINIYDATNVKTPPYAIHEDASLAYLALLPKGFGVDAPSGDQMALGEWKGRLPLSFEVSEEESVVYLLENGEAWAYSLRLKNPPANWNQYATVFVHLRVDNFNAECIDETTAETKPMANCDPLGGNDLIKYYGTVDPESEEDLISILGSVEFK